MKPHLYKNSVLCKQHIINIEADKNMYAGAGKVLCTYEASL